jgi:hypothetical protein
MTEFSILPLLQVNLEQYPGLDFLFKGKYVVAAGSVITDKNNPERYYTYLNPEDINLNWDNMEVAPDNLMELIHELSDKGKSVVKNNTKVSTASYNVTNAFTDLTN